MINALKSDRRKRPLQNEFIDETVAKGNYIECFLNFELTEKKKKMLEEDKIIQVQSYIRPTLFYIFSFSSFIFSLFPS